MPRIACVLVPNFAVAAACRAEPELAGRPLVLAEGRGPHARVVAVSAAARARGIRPGCTASEIDGFQVAQHAYEDLPLVHGSKNGWVGLQIHASGFFGKRTAIGKGQDTAAVKRV